VLAVSLRAPKGRSNPDENKPFYSSFW